MIVCDGGPATRSRQIPSNHGPDLSGIVCCARLSFFFFQWCIILQVPRGIACEWGGSLRFCFFFPRARFGCDTCVMMRSRHYNLPDIVDSSARVYWFGVVVRCATLSFFIFQWLFILNYHEVLYLNGVVVAVLLIFQWLFVLQESRGVLYVSAVVLCVSYLPMTVHPQVSRGVIGEELHASTTYLERGR